MAIKKSKKKAMFLALFGGLFGLHWFYLGRTMMGFLYLFFFFKLFHVSVLGLPLVVFLSLLNAFQFYKVDQKKFDRKYNKNWLREERKHKKKKKQSEPTDTRKNSVNKEQKEQKKSRSTISRQKKQVAKILKQADAKYTIMDLKSAEEDYLKVLSIDPQNPDAAYRLACIYSVWEDKDKAFRYLEQAVKNGLKDPGEIDKEEKLAFIRIQEEYQTFRNNGYRVMPLKRLPQEEETYVNKLIQLKELREQGKIEEVIYREELQKLKKQYGNTQSDIE